MTESSNRQRTDGKRRQGRRLSESTGKAEVRQKASPETERDHMASSGDDRLTWENYEKKNLRPHMDKSRRAKIFLPFNALEGLYDVLGEKEKKSEPRIELSEDEMQLLNEKLLALKKGDYVTVTYYDVLQDDGRCVGSYTSESGLLTGISYDRKTLRVRNTVIPVPDILRIEKHPDGE